MKTVAKAENLSEAFIQTHVTKGEIREERTPKQKETCTMCGDFCAMKKGMEIFEQDITDKR